MFHERPNVLVGGEKGQKGGQEKEGENKTALTSQTSKNNLYNAT